MKKALMLVLTVVTAYGQTTGGPALRRLGENDLPVIHTQRGFSTLIEFPADQKIREITCGDKEFWVVEGTGRFLHVKPAKEGIVTNLNVIVDGDVVYAFILREINRAGGSKEKPDLQVTVSPGEDPKELRASLDASVRENASLKESVSEREQAFAELNQKYEAEKAKSAKRDELARTSAATPAIQLGSTTGSAPSGASTTYAPVSSVPAPAAPSRYASPSSSNYSYRPRYSQRRQ